MCGENPQGLSALSPGDGVWDRHSCLSLRVAHGAPPRRQECLRHFTSRTVTVERSLLPLLTKSGRTYASSTDKDRGQFYDLTKLCLYATMLAYPAAKAAGARESKSRVVKKSESTSAQGRGSSVRGQSPGLSGSSDRPFVLGSRHGLDH